MNLRRKLERLERESRERPCPLCARHLGVKRCVTVSHTGPVDPALYCCPQCGAAPPSVKIHCIVPDAEECAA